MLIDLFPRAHARFAALPLVGSHLDRFVRWLGALGLAKISISRRISRTPRLDNMLRGEGVRELSQLSRADLLAFAPRRSSDDKYLSAVVRSLAAYLGGGEGRSLPRLPRQPSNWLVPIETASTRCEDSLHRRPGGTTPVRRDSLVSCISTTIRPCCERSARHTSRGS